MVEKKRQNIATKCDPNRFATLVAKLIGVKKVVKELRF